jgi:hypothetical protein
MTPEERFTRIENFLLTVAEHQADHDAHFREMEGGLAELRAAQTTLAIAMTHVAEAQRRTDEALERLARSHERTEDVQRITEASLNALIETVDRIIRRDGPDA